MVDPRDIHSLTSFQRNAREHIERVNRTGRPEVLTVNGAAELVVLSPDTYQRLVSRGEPAAPFPAYTTGSTRSPDLAVREIGPDPVIDAYRRHVDRTLLRENLRRTPEDRLRGLMELQRLADEAERAGRAARRPEGDA